MVRSVADRTFQPWDSASLLVRFFPFFGAILAEGAREAIGGLAFPGEASDGGDQDDEGDVLFVVESDLNPFGIGAGLMTLGSMANRADSTAHGEVGELAVDALQFFFQLVGREVVETGFLPPRGSHEQEC